jgi:transposase InsO family protein
MRELGLKAKAPKRYKATTDSRHEFPAAPNLLDRQFEVDSPNKVWTTDITYILPSSTNYCLRSYGDAV